MYVILQLYVAENFANSTPKLAPVVGIYPFGIISYQIISVWCLQTVSKVSLLLPIVCRVMQVINSCGINRKRGRDWICLFALFKVFLLMVVASLPLETR